MPRKPRRAAAKAGPSKGASQGASRQSKATPSDGPSDTFLEKLLLNPSAMGGFMKLYKDLAKKLDRQEKRAAQRRGLAEDEDGRDSDSDDDFESVMGRALADMEAKMDAAGSSGQSDDQLSPQEIPALMTSEESCSSDEDAEGADAAGSRVNYVRFRDKDFAKAVAGASRIASLSLVKLFRARDDSKTDKHVEAVLGALGSATKDVAALHLGDAEWASSRRYSPLLANLLASYKNSLRKLSLTSRLLLQPNNGKKKGSIWEVVSRMPNLEELRLTYKPLSLHYYTYGSELRVSDDDVDYDDDDDDDDIDEKVKEVLKPFMSSRPNPTVLPALKSIHLHLTEDWFQRQFRNAIWKDEDDDDEEDEKDEDEEVEDEGNEEVEEDDGEEVEYDYDEEDEYDNVGGGEHEEEQENFLEDLLKSMKGVITVLDMACVQKTRMKLQIVKLFANLTSLRSIVLRVELVPVTARMERLEDVTVVFHSEPNDAAVARAAAFITEAPASWTNLRALSLRVPAGGAANHWPEGFKTLKSSHPARKVQPSWNQVLSAAASTCRSLTRLELQGSGWEGAALQQVLASNPGLESVELPETSVLEPRHLTLLRDMAALKRVQLSAVLRRAKKSADLLARCQEEWSRRAVNVQWIK